MILKVEVKEKYIKAIEKSINMTEFINRCLEQKYKTLTINQIIQSSTEEIQLLISKICSALNTDINKVFELSENNRAIRKREVVIHRHIIRYLIYNTTTLSMEQTGKITRCDHATVLHSIKSVRNMIETRDFDFMKMVKEGFEIKDKSLMLKTNEIEYYI